MICDSTISPHLCIATIGQRSRVSGKLFLSSALPLVVNGGHRDPNAIAAQRKARLLSNTCQKMQGGKHVKVKKQQRQDIRKTDFSVHGDPP